jgi:hypothetical protein
LNPAEMAGAKLHLANPGLRHVNVKSRAVDAAALYTFGAITFSSGGLLLVPALVAAVVVKVSGEFMLNQGWEMVKAFAKADFAIPQTGNGMNYTDGPHHVPQDVYEEGDQTVEDAAPEAELGA